MRAGYLFAIFVAISTCSATDRNDAWESWKRSYGKVYNGAEQNRRRVEWEKSFNKIEEHNRRYDLGLESYKMGLNKFSDLSFDEFRSQYLLNFSFIQKTSKDQLPASEVTERAPVPDSIDWRNKNAVRVVKDQGHCGSCWAFSTVAAVEGQYYLKTQKKIEFSEQQLVDCSEKYGNHGCHGGLMELAYAYINDFGIDIEATYPYKGQESECSHDEPDDDAVRVVGKRVVHSGSEVELKTLVGTYGPAAVAIDVTENFMHYKSGIFADGTCSTRWANHAVTLVGYGSEADGPYWLVKNSWSENWGDSGYIKMARNANGACGIAFTASVPILKIK